MEEFFYGQHVKVADGVGPLGVLDPINPRKMSDAFVTSGEVGMVVAAPGYLPDGWLFVSFDAGLAPVHPSMVVVA